MSAGLRSGGALFEAIKPELMRQMQGAQTPDERFELLTSCIAALSGVLSSLIGAAATAGALEAIADINREACRPRTWGKPQ